MSARRPLGPRLGLAVVVAGWLSGCATTGVPGSTASGTATNTSAGASTTTGTTGTSAPAKADPRQPWTRPALASSAVAAKAKGKRLTDSGDLTCQQLVASYELTDNLQILQTLGMDGFFQAVQQVFDSIARGTSAQLAAQPAKEQIKHAIPYQLRTAAYQMNWVPMELEIAYGEELARQLNVSGGIEPMDTEAGVKLYEAADKLLAETLAGIDEPHAYKFKAVVTTRPDQNASALPGGIVLIDPALLDDPKLARKAKFAMAHEIGHVLQRHQTRAMQARIIDTVSLRGSLPDMAKVMGEAKSSPKAVIPLILAGKLQFEKFYVDQELHSDGCAVRILNHTQPSTTEMLAVVTDFIARLPKPTNDGKAEPTTVAAPAATNVTASLVAVQKSTKDAEALIDLVTRPVERHPTSKERVDNLNKALVGLRQEIRQAAPAATPPARTRARPTAPQTAPQTAPR